MHDVNPRASRDVVEEITALWALLAWLEDGTQQEVRSSVRSGEAPTPGRLGPGL